MAAQLSPVTPDVLRWAIDEDGRPVSELAEALKVDVDTVDGWARGDAVPTRGEVSRLAALLRRPRAFFFLPRPPAQATLPPSFRHPPGDDHPVSISARRRVRQARRVQHAVSWALRDEPPVEIGSATIQSQPEQAASSAREWLGITAEAQSAWHDDRAALRAWREALDKRGILVFILEIGPGDVRGFSAWDEHAPLIVANSSRVSPAARTFTLAHELGHLYTRNDAACVEQQALVGPNTDQTERWCERFGAALLMPEPMIRAFANRLRGQATTEDVRAAALHFRVSHRAAALRLIDTGYASRSLYGEVLREFVPIASVTDSSSEFRQPSRAVARPREYGIRTIRTVLDALPPRDALAILRMTVEDVRRIAGEVPDVRVP